MHPSVTEAWPAIARHHEGVIRWPYLDTVSMVTVGIGLLIEANNAPTTECFRLPWTVDSRPASQAQIAAGWRAVNVRTDLAGKARAFETVSRLRLDDATINGALLAKTREFWSILSAQLPDLEDWPADAQMALIDMAYQLGPRFLGSKWPSFTAAAHSGDFMKCSQHCSVRQASAERNEHRIRWFQNAARVEFLDIAPGRFWDQDTPTKDDDVALSDEDKKWLSDLIDRKLEDLLPAIWDSVEVDILEDGAEVIRPATAIERLLARKVT